MHWITPEFKQRVIGAFGPDGPEWLARLPEQVAEYERRWSIKIIGPVAELSYNFVALAERRDGSRAVLKLGALNPMLLGEMKALGYFDGRGVCRLLECDLTGGAMLVEYIQPGRPLGLLEDDDQATAIAADMMLRLRRPSPADPDLPTLARFARGFERLRAAYQGSSGPLPARLVERAERLFIELDASAEPALIHGDLHQYNILEAGQGEWLAIDPFGVVGDPAYEAGPLLYNPLPDFPRRPGLAGALDRRLGILSERLEIDRQRLAAWGFAQAVLSAVWSLEGSDPNWGQTLPVAEALW